MMKAMCALGNIPVPVPEFKFHRDRKWRFDWAWPAEKIALEQEGGTWTKGRHTRGSGYLKDMEKYNAAVLSGWRVLRYTPDQIARGVWIAEVHALMSDT